MIAESENRRHRAEVVRWVRFWAHKPSQSELAGCALIVVTILLGHFYLIARTADFEKMFKEMDIGEMPTSTTVWMMWARLNADFWYLPVAMVLGVFVLTSRASRYRVGLFCAALIVLIFGEWWASAPALFEPMVKIMERMSGPAH